MPRAKPAHPRRRLVALESTPSDSPPSTARELLQPENQDSRKEEREEEEERREEKVVVVECRWQSCTVRCESMALLAVHMDRHLAAVSDTICRWRGCEVCYQRTKREETGSNQALYTPFFALLFPRSNCYCTTPHTSVTYILST